MDVAVDVDHVARAGLTVKPVDVLRQDPDAREPLFDLRDEGMRAVERRAATRRFDLMNVLPRERGLFPHRLSGEHLLDRTPLGRLSFFVQSADAPIGG